MHEIQWPGYVLKALEALERAGYASWAVGGCVRDALLGVTAHDWDLCTPATPAQMRACLGGFRLIATGEKHGTLTALVDGVPVEITTFRTDGAYSDHRRPDGVRFVGELREDLRRRDFTINAMACHPQRGLADPFGGREDLATGIVRCVGVARERFEEDGLRILRAMRFAARLHFHIEAQTARAMLECRGLLGCIARERIYAELRGILMANGAAEVLSAFPQLLAAAVPQLVCQGMAWERSLALLNAAPEDFALRLALLAQEVPVAEGMLAGLKADAATREDVLALLRASGERVPATVAQVRRLLCAQGAQRARRLCAFWKMQGRPGAVEAGALVEEALARGDCVALSQLKIDGKRLMALGFPPGREIGTALQALLTAVMEDWVENSEEPLAVAAMEILHRKTDCIDT